MVAVSVELLALLFSGVYGLLICDLKLTNDIKKCHNQRLRELEDRTLKLEESLEGGSSYACGEN